MSRVVHFQSYERRTKFGALEITLLCKSEPISIWGKELYLSDKKQITCKRCKAKIKRGNK
jgi:hypothetical protein